MISSLSSDMIAAARSAFGWPWTIQAGSLGS